MTRPATPDARQVLSRDLSVFLVQFSIALHKNAVYPEGHPLLLSAVEAVTLRLTALLHDRPVLSIGVAKNQLVIDGAATDASNAVLRELAHRLYRHQLGAVKFSQGAGPDEIADLLRTMGSESRDSPVGLRSATELERWPHIRLFPLAFEQLQLMDGAQKIPDELVQGRSAQLWQSLAAAALSAQDLGPHTPSLDPGDVARAINDQKRDESYDRVIVNYLLQLGRELRLSEGGETAVLERRLTSLVAGLRPDVLRRLLEVSGDLAKRQELVSDLSSVVPVKAVLELLKGAADLSQQTISNSMLRLLTKLALHAEGGSPYVRTDADSALRDTVRQLVDGWTLTDPNPQSYTELLERLARPSSAQTPSPEASEFEAPRLVQISLEIGAYGESVWRAADAMIEKGQAGTLLTLLEQTKGQEQIVEAFWQHLATPKCLRGLLVNEGKDLEAVERIITRLGIAAAEPMLEALELTDSRTIRRRLLTRLGQLGDDIGPLVLARLTSAPWFVQRNMLALLGTLAVWPPGFSPRPYAEHSDPRVRREALKMMIRLPALRDEAICAGLADDDHQIIRLVIGAALEGCPAAAVPRLMVHLNARETDPELRALGVRVLGALKTSAVRDWLLARAVTKKRWFRGPKLQNKSSELLAVLSGLASNWRQDPKVVGVLRLAEASADAEVRAVVAGAGAPS